MTSWAASCSDAAPEGRHVTMQSLDKVCETLRGFVLTQGLSENTTVSRRSGRVLRICAAIVDTESAVASTRSADSFTRVTEQPASAGIRRQAKKFFRGHASVLALLDDDQGLRAAGVHQEGPFGSVIQGNSSDTASSKEPWKVRGASIG